VGVGDAALLFEHEMHQRHAVAYRRVPRRRAPRARPCSATSPEAPERTRRRWPAATMPAVACNNRARTSPSMPCMSASAQRVGRRRVHRPCVAVKEPVARADSATR
jgi:hypothetical protein